jgi:hypothetical protein
MNGCSAVVSARISASGDSSQLLPQNQSRA